MAFFDLNEEDLFNYQPQVAEPVDFDEFWAHTLQEAATYPLAVTLKPVDTGLDLVDSFDVEFCGFGGDRIKAWLTLPAGAAPGSLPAVVSYVGYGGGRGLSQEHLVWANAGYAHLVMDTRGQGSVWGTGGHTPDPTGAGPAVPGFLTRGIENPESYYYRRVITDAVRAVAALRAVPQVDPKLVAVTGASQGGGIAMAVAGLIEDLFAVMPDVPFLCNYRRAIAVTDNAPYSEITTYLSTHHDSADAVFDTLSYFDGVNFAKRATAPALFSVALMDPVCPPSTVISAYLKYGALLGASGSQPTSAGPEKEIEIYPYNQHEGGQFHQVVKQVHWLRKRVSQSGGDSK